MKLPSLSSLSGDIVIYKKLSWIEEIAKRKYGPDIFVLGTPLDELNLFWRSLSYHALSASYPKEVGRAIVDIDSKCHVNRAEGQEETIEKSDQPDDWYDEFEITSKKGSSQLKSKSYQLQLATSTTKQVGGNLNVKVGPSGFFNMAAPEAGINASYSKTTSQQQTTEDKQEETLSQEYQLVDRLKVPPKTKVRAEITTWAVTYESKTLTEVSVDETVSLPIYYRTMFSRKLGGIFLTKGSIPAKEIFSAEEEFKCEEGTITFKRHGTVSYLGEEVEIKKDKTPFEGRSHI